MDTWSIIVTVICCLLAIGITIVGWQRGAGARHLLRGLGWFLLPLGLLFAGVMALIVKGTQYTYDWLMTTYLDLTHQIGLGLVVAGLLFLVISLFVKGRTREQMKEVRLARRQPAVGGSPGRRDELPGRPAAATQPAAAPAAKPAAKGGLSDEDAEIEALLKKRGIE